MEASLDLAPLLVGRKEKNLVGCQRQCPLENTPDSVTLGVSPNMKSSDQ